MITNLVVFIAFLEAEAIMILFVCIIKMMGKLPVFGYNENCLTY